jgi:hypothetical protein
MCVFGEKKKIIPKAIHFGVTFQTSFAIPPTRLPHRDETQHHVLL